MRKFYLFLAGALLAIPAFSQGEGEYNKKFERHPQDAKVIFTQDFEVPANVTPAEAYKKWSTTPVDTIHELYYYNRRGSGNISRIDIYDGSPDWEIFAVRTDSTTPGHAPGTGILVCNGVEATSSESEQKAGVFDVDHYEIVSDGGLDNTRNDAFAGYGENGGKYFFQYTGGNVRAACDSGLISTSNYTKDTHSSKKYRRALYIRGFDIEDETSYRLTLYLKTEMNNKYKPEFYADVMRGYFHQRETFSMGINSGKKYDLENPELTNGKWEKITLMTYYINDSIADGYTFIAGYNWGKDWFWHPSEDLWPAGKTLAADEKLTYIKQPDKYFVRLSFATDSVTYSVDNISLTKSWIGGCEYYQDKIRIDFGYETNLSELVAEEMAKTNMPLVEVPDEMGKYFEVWGLKKGKDSKDPDNWEEVYIRSAEYHSDGYMYMFTDYNEVNQELIPILFTDYDSVLVTFRNPVDQPELTLKYTGSKYPKPLDEKWVNAGKIVPDFYNEIATPNPYIFANVRSKDALPPIMMKAQHEDGAFGLPANTNTLSFKFSGDVLVDKEFKGQLSDYVVAQVVNSKGTEVWIPSFDKETSTLTLTRPGGLSDLKGDYEIQITGIKSTNGTGDDVVLHYHFGTFDTNPKDPTVLYHSDWRNDLGANKDNVSGCVPSTTWIRDHNSGSKPVFTRGNNGPVDDILVDGKQAKCCLFLLGGTEEGASDNLDNCAYYICSRQKTDNQPGHMWSIVDFTAAGDYVIKFKAVGYKSNNKAENCLKFYPKPDKDENSLTFSDFDGVANKEVLGDIQPELVMSSADAKSGTATWPVGTETFEFEFNVPAAGKYVFEWYTIKGTTSGDGLLIGNYSISNKVVNDLSVKYVKKLLSAVSDAQKKLDATTDAKYQGTDYSALNTAKTEAAAYQGNYPSQYDSVVANINAKLQAFNLRVDTVNLFYKTEDDVATKLAGLKGDSARLLAYKALDDHKKANASLVPKDKTTAQLTAEIKAYEKEMEAIDDRLALNEKFATKIKETKALIDDKNARKDFDEFTAMSQGYTTAAAFDKFGTADAELTAATNALITAKNGYWFRYDKYVARTRQIKELFALAADTLGYDFAGFGKKDSVKAVVNALEDDDPALSKVLREAAVLQILKIYKEKDAAELKKLANLDVSALIPNYYLANNANANRDLEKNKNGEWYIKKNVTNSDVIPNWTIQTKTHSQYDMKWYFTTANTTEDYVEASYVDWEVDGHVFVGGIRSAIRTQGVISTEISGLPHGYYKAGLYLYNNSSDLYYEFKSTKDTTYKSTYKLLNGDQKNTKFKELCVDSVLVDTALSFVIDQQSTSSGEVDIRRAVLRLSAPDDKFDYSDAVIAAQQTKLNEAITLVDAPAQAKAYVEYYTLGGIKINAPKSGEILIRKTSRGGKIIVDKVLIK